MDEVCLSGGLEFGLPGKPGGVTAEAPPRTRSVFEVGLRGDPESLAVGVLSSLRGPWAEVGALLGDPLEGAGVPC